VQEQREGKEAKECKAYLMRRQKMQRRMESVAVTTTMLKKEL
jgi:hypothetical protein